MIKLRKSQDRGHANHGWLDSHHTFSFADYHDPQYSGFRDLLVINEDRVTPGAGFGTHGHRDMEIVSVVLEGSLEHKDSMGTGSVLTPGFVQLMSAGAGVRHSEFNSSKDKPLHFLQIWITPKERGGKPSYEERRFPSEERKNRLRLIVSPDGHEGSLSIKQDALVYVSELEDGKAVDVSLKKGRHAWVQVARGSIELTGQTQAVVLGQGDGAAVSGEELLKLKARQAAEFLVFDLS